MTIFCIMAAAAAVASIFLQTSSTKEEKTSKVSSQIDSREQSEVGNQVKGKRDEDEVGDRD
jgi:hypothetical protein